MSSQSHSNPFSIQSPPAICADERLVIAVIKAEHLCPLDLPHLDKQRWKALFIQHWMAGHEMALPSAAGPSAAKTYEDVRVGDGVWWDDVNRRGHFSSGTVTKVGRSLIYVGKSAFRKDTGYMNDGFGHQHLILDLQAHQQRIKADNMFVKLRIQNKLPDGVSPERVAAAAALLGIVLEG